MGVAEPSAARPRTAVDLYDPDTWAAGVPHEELARLRREDPLHFCAEPRGPGFWAVTKHADIVRMSRDPRTFSSWLGGTTLDTPPPEGLAMTRMIMLNMDPPQHVKFRKLVRREFTPQRIGRLEPHLRELGREVVARAVRKGECDFVDEIAAELPLLVIAELMGIPLEDRRRIFELSNRLVGFDDPEFRTSEEDGRKAATEMWLYAHELGARRRAEPRDDLVTALVRGEVDGEKLTEQEFNNFFLLLAVAGNETTRNLISGGMLALFEHRDQWERLLADRSLLSTAVEEMLRWVTAVVYFRRTLTRDVELRGKRMRSGDKVALYYISANRDEDVFEDPFRFDVGRDPNPHLAFGIGEHFCLGSHLARLEIRLVFEELLRAAPGIELAAPPRRLRSNFINGTKEMRVRFAPRA